MRGPLEGSVGKVPGGVCTGQSGLQAPNVSSWWGLWRKLGLKVG